MGILLLKTIVNTTFFFNVDFKLMKIFGEESRINFHSILKGYQI